MSLYLGSMAPPFSAPSLRNPKFVFSSLGGHWVVLAFLPPPGPARDAAFNAIAAHKQAFLHEDGRLLMMGVLPDAASLAQVREIPPGIGWLDDRSGTIRRLYDAETETGAVDAQWVLIDPMLRVVRVAPLDQAEAFLTEMSAMPAIDAYPGAPANAPVLIVPRVFEPHLCRQLIELYESQGGTVSGVMRERDGRTVPVIDNFKKRRDATIADEALQNQLRLRIARRLAPEILKAYRFEATRIERYIVACYDAIEGGYFRPHRDNTTAGTAHRRFAVSINLNSEEFEGGDLRFPEFGRRTYRPPTGGAVVFCCSLLHEATPVTRGTRYAFLPFLYDDAGAAIREANTHLLDRTTVGA
jgi:predicted 2-oxoglutarate/Fe(II)-dependent dioxygenase YbiX